MKRNKRLKTEYEDGVHFVVAVSAKVKKNKKTKKGAVNGKTKAPPPSEHSSPAVKVKVNANWLYGSWNLVSHRFVWRFD